VAIRYIFRMSQRSGSLANLLSYNVFRDGSDWVLRS
jgi:hypothetical protein